MRMRTILLLLVVSLGGEVSLTLLLLGMAIDLRWVVAVQKSERGRIAQDVGHGATWMVVRIVRHGELTGVVRDEVSGEAGRVELLCL